MSILKALRKPYLSIFLSGLILFISCSQYEDDQLENQNTVGLSSYINKHLELSSLLSHELKINKVIDLKTLNNISYDQNLELALDSLNFNNKDRILSILNKMENNTSDFFSKNEHFQNIDIDTYKNLITAEINIALTSLEYHKQRGSCEDAFDNSTGNCLENLALASAVALGTAFISFGVGTAYALTAATLIMVKCMSDAEDAYDDCRSQQNQQ